MDSVMGGIAPLFSDRRAGILDAPALMYNGFRRTCLVEVELDKKQNTRIH